MGHVVPIDLVDSSAKELRPRCTTSQFQALGSAEEAKFLPGGSGQWGYGQEEMLSWTYYGFGMGNMTLAASRARALALARKQPPMTECLLAKWRCAAASTWRLWTEQLDASRDWSSIPAIIT